MDYEGAVNAVLRRMRVPTITAVTDNAYSTLIGEFVNQAKREVEDAFDWRVLNRAVSINTIGATKTYTVTGINHRARFKFIHNVTNKGDLIQVTKEFFERQENFTQASNSQPSYYIITPSNTADTVDIELYPTPDGTYNLLAYIIDPDDDLTADTDHIKVPYWPVVLGAYVLALAERGDESGMSERRAQTDYQSALSDAIAQDSWQQTQNMEIDWRVG